MVVYIWWCSTPPTFDTTKTEFFFGGVENMDNLGVWKNLVVLRINFGGIKPGGGLKGFVLCQSDANNNYKPLKKTGV